MKLYIKILFYLLFIAPFDLLRGCVDGVRAELKYKKINPDLTSDIYNFIRSNVEDVQDEKL